MCSTMCHVSAEGVLTHCAAPTAAACCGRWLLSHRGVQSVWQLQHCQAGLWLSQAGWVGTKHLQQLGVSGHPPEATHSVSCCSYYLHRSSWWFQLPDCSARYI